MGTLITEDRGQRTEEERGAGTSVLRLYDCCQTSALDRKVTVAMSSEETKAKLNMSLDELAAGYGEDGESPSESRNRGLKRKPEEPRSGLEPSHGVKRNYQNHNYKGGKGKGHRRSWDQPWSQEWGKGKGDSSFSGQHHGKGSIPHEGFFHGYSQFCEGKGEKGGKGKGKGKGKGWHSEGDYFDSQRYGNGKGYQEPHNNFADSSFSEFDQGKGKGKGAGKGYRSQDDGQFGKGTGKGNPHIPPADHILVPLPPPAPPLSSQDHDVNAWGKGKGKGTQVLPAYLYPGSEQKPPDERWKNNPVYDAPTIPDFSEATPPIPPHHSPFSNSVPPHHQGKGYGKGKGNYGGPPAMCGTPVQPSPMPLGGSHQALQPRAPMDQHPPSQMNYQQQAQHPPPPPPSQPLPPHSSGGGNAKLNSLGLMVPPAIAGALEDPQARKLIKQQLLVGLQTTGASLSPSASSQVHQILLAIQALDERDGQPSSSTPPQGNSQNILSLLGSSGQAFNPLSTRPSPSPPEVPPGFKIVTMMDIHGKPVQVQQALSISPQGEGEVQVEVENCPEGLAAEDLQGAFSENGKAKALRRVVVEKSGSALLTFSSKEEAEKCIKRYNGGDLNGKTIKLRIKESSAQLMSSFSANAGKFPSPSSFQGGIGGTTQLLNSGGMTSFPDFSCLQNIQSANAGSAATPLLAQQQLLAALALNPSFLGAWGGGRN